MKLHQIAAKPQLIKVVLDDEEVIQTFGESLEFYMWDRQSMSSFVKLATIDYQQFGQVAEIVKEFVLDEEGNPVVKDDLVLPTNIMMKAITKVIDTLGKSVTIPVTPTQDSKQS